MKTNQLKAGAILSYVSMGLSYLISIAYTPIMLRLLGQSEYGLYNLVISVVSYLGLFSFGFGSAYVRYYSRYKVNDEQENIAKLNGMFFIVFCILGFIAILAGVALVFNIDLIFGKKLTVDELATAKILMTIMIFNIGFSFPTNIFNSYIIANEKYVFQKTLQIVRAIVNPFIMLPLLLLGYKSIGMVIVATLLTIFVELANVFFCFKRLGIRFSFRKFNFSLMKEMTIFSSYIFMNMIIDQINWNVDKLILGRFRGTIAVAIYGLAAQINNYYLSLGTTISSVFVPRVNQMIAKSNGNKELTSLFTRIGRIQFILLSLVGSGLIFFGQPFINMWAGTNYSEAYPIMLLLVIPATFSLIQNLGVEIQRAKNMHQFRSWMYFFIAVGNMLISIPLAKMYGGIGAALGTAISFIIGNGFIMNWYYHNRVGLDIIYFWKQILKFSKSLVLPIITGVLIYFFVDLHNVIQFIIYGFIYLIVFCSSLWFLGMNQYEKDLIAKPVLRILKKLN